MLEDEDYPVRSTPIKVAKMTQSSAKLMAPKLSKAFWTEHYFDRVPTEIGNAAIEFKMQQPHCVIL